MISINLLIAANVSAASINVTLDYLGIFGEYIPEDITNFVDKIKNMLDSATSEIEFYTIYGVFDRKKKYQIGVERRETTIGSFVIIKSNFIISL